MEVLIKDAFKRKLNKQAVEMRSYSFPSKLFITKPSLPMHILVTYKQKMPTILTAGRVCKEKSIRQKNPKIISMWLCLCQPMEVDGCEAYGVGV